MSAFGTLLTRVMSGYFEHRFSSFDCLVASVSFDAMPAYIQDGLVESGFLAGFIGYEFAVPVFPGLWFTGHSGRFQILKNNDFHFTVNHLPAGFMAKIITDIRYFFMLSGYSVFSSLTAV